MLLASTNFLVFFLFIAIFYFLIPFKFRTIFLLIASYFFYSTYKIEYLVILLLLTVFNFYTGILIGNEKSKKTKKNILIISLFSNISVLCFFKYFDINSFGIFLQNILARLNIHFSMPPLNMILPVGLSFYTFKIMNYIIDVYRGTVNPEKRLINFALYVSFFPQMIAGPIDRARLLLPQFYKSFEFDYARVTDGIKLILWGFFQKLVIADNLATFVDPIFNNPTQYEGLILITASLFFTFQILCDFSGYTDIAIGSAQILGFISMKNFDCPYFAQSIPEFWRRWHISLTSWFRDYLYIPLGGNRVSIHKWYFNILIVFLLSGLWHGSTWTFAIWGAIHGIYYLLSVSTQKIREKLLNISGLYRFTVFNNIRKTFITFLLVNFAWIFFRANSFNDAIYIITHLFSGWGINSNSLTLLNSLKFEIFIGGSSIIFLLIVQYLQNTGSIREILRYKPIWLRWMLYYLGIITILLLGNFGVKQFIYFKF